MTQLKPSVKSHSMSVYLPIRYITLVIILTISQVFFSEAAFASERPKIGVVLGGGGGAKGAAHIGGSQGIGRDADPGGLHRWYQYGGPMLAACMPLE